MTQKIPDGVLYLYSINVIGAPFGLYMGAREVGSASCSSGSLHIDPALGHDL